MYALVTHHDEKYLPLANLTWEQNKVAYAEKHGYSTYARTEDFATATSTVPMTGFERIYILKDVFEYYPECEWAWWTGTDSIITNFNIKIEDKIDNNYHFIVSSDINGINDDSLLVRNSPEGRAILDKLLSMQEEYLQYWDTSQAALSNIMGFPRTGDKTWPTGKNLVVNEEYRNIIKLMPQRYMNGFNYFFYREYLVHNDKFGENGNWQTGDWLFHWPALPNDFRIQLYHNYNQYIVK